MFFPEPVIQFKGQKSRGSVLATTNQMETKPIHFADRQVLTVFPKYLAGLPEATKALGLEEPGPALVLIGGQIATEHAAATEQALQTIAKTVNETGALIICGGTDMGVMAKIGQIRTENNYQFPLVGIAPESQVTWPNGPKSKRFLWWGTHRWPLASGYTHFILVPGKEFGDESLWITQTATQLAGKYSSVTVLLNGGEIARKDIKLSLESLRPVIALAGTGRYADELAAQPKPPNLVTIIQATDKTSIFEAICTKLKFR